MAYTVNQESTGLRGSYDDLIYVVQDTLNTGDPRYRYACEVRVDSVAVALLLQLPNNVDCAVFNTRVIAAQYVQPDEDKWFLGQAASLLLSQNTKAFKTITMRFGYSSSTSIELEPVLTLDTDYRHRSTASVR